VDTTGKEELAEKIKKKLRDKFPDVEALIAMITKKLKNSRIQLITLI